MAALAILAILFVTLLAFLLCRISKKADQSLEHQLYQKALKKALK